MLRKKRQGNSLVELLAVLALIAGLLGLLLPAVQRTREAAREFSCRNNLKGLALSAINYESLGRGYPVGTLGMWFKPGLTQPEWADPTHPQYWGNFQHYSSLISLLPFLEYTTHYDRLPTNRLSTSMQHAFDENEARKLFALSIAAFQCPTDNVLASNPIDSIGYLIATSPGIAGLDSPSTISEGYFSAYLGEHLSDQLSMTNYVGCSGAHAGIPLPSHPSGFEGFFGSRRATFAKDIKDGLSMTVLYGETIGGIHNGARHTLLSWAHGGLARGRGNADWGLPYSSTPFFTMYMFGDWHQASRFGFGSQHDTVVNISFGDGSVRAVDRSIDVWPWYALCGRSDGSLTVD